MVQWVRRTRFRAQERSGCQVASFQFANAFNRIAFCAPENGTEKNAPEKNTHEKNTPEKNAPKENTPEENAPEKNAPEENAPEENVGNQRRMQVNPNEAAPSEASVVDPIGIVPMTAAEHLSQLIQCETVSCADPRETNWRAFEALHDCLRACFPLVHQTLRRETIASHALLYHWQAAPSEQSSGAVVLLAHQDVVAAPDAGNWTYPPFSGTIAEDCVWGRGALDMKSQLIAIFEAIEAMIKDGFSPRRDVYIALGKDEEATTHTSAIDIAATLRERGVAIDLLLDEGMNCFLPASLFGASGTMACIHVCEKGYGTLTIESEGADGHASMPDGSTSLGRLAMAAARVERKPLPARLASPVTDTIDALLPHMSRGTRFLYRHRRLFAPLLLRRLARNRQTNAWTRSTAALTTAQASPQSNVLPAQSSMQFSLRCAPWDTLRMLVYRVRFRIRNADIRIRVDALPATPIAPTDGPAYRAVIAAVCGCFPDTIPVPSLMLGGTDAAHFCEDCANVYRFSPFRSYARYGHTIHAVDERVAIEDLAEAAQFFAALLQHAGAVTR